MEENHRKLHVRRCSRKVLEKVEWKDVIERGKTLKELYVNAKRRRRRKEKIYQLIKAERLQIKSAKEEKGRQNGRRPLKAKYQNNGGRRCLKKYAEKTLLSRTKSLNQLNGVDYILFSVLPIFSSSNTPSHVIIIKKLN